MMAHRALLAAAAPAGGGRPRPPGLARSMSRRNPDSEVLDFNTVNESTLHLAPCNRGGLQLTRLWIHHSWSLLPEVYVEPTMDCSTSLRPPAGWTYQANKRGRNRNLCLWAADSYAVLPDSGYTIHGACRPQFYVAPTLHCITSLRPPAGWTYQGNNRCRYRNRCVRAKNSYVAVPDSGYTIYGVCCPALTRSHP